MNDPNKLISDIYCKLLALTAEVGKCSIGAQQAVEKDTDNDLLIYRDYTPTRSADAEVSYHGKTCLLYLVKDTNGIPLFFAGEDKFSDTYIAGKTAEEAAYRFKKAVDDREAYGK